MDPLVYYLRAGEWTDEHKIMSAPIGIENSSGINTTISRMFLSDFDKARFGPIVEPLTSILHDFRYRDSIVLANIDYHFSITPYREPYDTSLYPRVLPYDDLRQSSTFNNRVSFRYAVSNEGEVEYMQYRMPTSYGWLVKPGGINVSSFELRTLEIVERNMDEKAISFIAGRGPGVDLLILNDYNRSALSLLKAGGDLVVGKIHSIDSAYALFLLFDNTYLFRPCTISAVFLVCKKYNPTLVEESTSIPDSFTSWWNTTWNEIISYENEITSLIYELKEEGEVDVPIYREVDLISILRL